MEIDHSIVVAHGWCKTTHSRSHMNRNGKKTTQTKHRQKQLKFTPTQCFNLCASFLPVSLSLFFHLLCWFALAVLLYYCIASIFKQFAMHSLANLRVITAFCFCCFRFFVRLSVDLIESICLLNLRI